MVAISAPVRRQRFISSTTSTSIAWLRSHWARSCRARTVAVGLGDPSGRRAGSPHTDTLAQFGTAAAADGQPTGFYAAVILRSSDGLPLGTLSVFDHQPRELTPRRALSCWRWRAVMALLELSRLRGEQERSRQIIDSAADYAPFSPLTCRAASPAGTAVRSGCWAGRRRKPSAATWRASSAKPIAPHRSPGRNAHGAGAGACRRRTLASAQGRLALLGQRHPHATAARRPDAGLRQDPARPNRIPSAAGGGARNRSATAPWSTSARRSSGNAMPRVASPSATATGASSPARRGELHRRRLAGRCVDQ